MCLALLNGFRKAAITDALENELLAPDNVTTEDDRDDDDDDPFASCDDRWNKVLSHTRTCFRHTLYGVL